MRVLAPLTLRTRHPPPLSPPQALPAPVIHSLGNQSYAGRRLSQNYGTPVMPPDLLHPRHVVQSPFRPAPLRYQVLLAPGSLAGKSIRGGNSCAPPSSSLPRTMRGWRCLSLTDISPIPRAPPPPPPPPKVSPTHNDQLCCAAARGSTFQPRSLAATDGRPASPAPLDPSAVGRRLARRGGKSSSGWREEPAGQRLAARCHVDGRWFCPPYGALLPHCRVFGAASLQAPRAHCSASLACRRLALRGQEGPHYPAAVGGCAGSEPPRG